jgi:transcriptional regulator with XRE-family HTH domain
MKKLVAMNLKTLRETAGYTQREVAELLEIERGAYANYESESPRLMPFILMKKTCDLYGILVSDLIKDNSEKVGDEFIYAFRVNAKNQSDQKEIANFKKVIRNYLKMCSY